jgi:hypothetical protein
VEAAEGAPLTDAEGEAAAAVAGEETTAAVAEAADAGGHESGWFVGA